MTRMLASVTGPQEAEIALLCGADIVDLKDPSRGALGAVDAGVIGATVRAVGRRRAVSAVAGDLPMEPQSLRAAASDIAGCGVDYVKLGIFPGGDPCACLNALAGLAARVKLIAVFFADAAPDFALLGPIARSGFAGAMIDTQGKSSGSLLRHCSLSRLRGFIGDCHALGLIAGLAGSLEAPDVPRLLAIAPDLLGFRGALCGAGGRAAALDLSRTQAIRGLIPHAAPTAARDVDYRLLARGYPPAGSADDRPVDHVFVADLVLPVRIGAYASEHAPPQSVRFAVDAAVLRAERPAEDMRDVFSYDLITDGIRMLADAGHVDLVETLAERIAALVLAHPRVTKVTVRVAKLDTGLGAVGVQIERTRAASRLCVRAGPHAATAAIAAALT
jgi:dihydroneopterin aldolase